MSSNQSVEIDVNALLCTINSMIILEAAVGGAGALHDKKELCKLSNSSSKNLT